MSNIQLAIIDPEYKQWICDIEKRFRQQQIKAAVQVNSSKIEFYCSLGRDICEMFLHTITEKCLLPLNIFAIPWGHHKASRFSPKTLTIRCQPLRSWRQR